MRRAVAVIAVLVAVVAAAATFSRNPNRLTLRAGESSSVSCSGPALNFTPSRATAGTLVCAPNPTTTTVPATTTTIPATTTTVPVTTTTVPATTTTTVAPPPPGGFPDASTTGVPAGTALTARSSSSCNWVISTPGTVVDGVDLAGCVDVEASNVTIQNSRLSGNTWWGVRLGVTNSSATNLRILHSTIQAAQGKGPDSGGYDYGISDQGGGSIEIGFDNISGYKDGTDITSGSIHDSYYHDLSTFNGAHVQDVYVYPGAGLTISHNTLINQASLTYTTAAVYIAPDAGHQHDVTMSGNLLAGGAYAFYGGDSTATNIVVSGNSFSTQVFPNCGNYGTHAYWWPNNAGNVWSGNVWADGPNAGKAVAA